MKTYHELICYQTFEERFKYLKLDAIVCDTTFGHARYLNQRFYKSCEWLNVRQKVIIRDNACDLGIPYQEIYQGIIIHHIEPISLEDIMCNSPNLTDMNNLICVSFNTHNLLHFGTKSQLNIPKIGERKDGDTDLW